MQRPQLMGIVNVTPDSFSDGGRLTSVADAVRHGLQLLDEGAEWLDVGGESTRPGAVRVSADEEASRVVPVIAGIRRARPRALVSVDTRKASVARAAIEVGASWVNDVSAAADPEMPALVAESGVGLVLMHMRGVPSTMQRDTRYTDLVSEVVAALQARVQVVEQAGVSRDRLMVDPGIGFGKAPGDNPLLVRAIPRLERQLGLPVLVGASRKRFVGEITGVHQASERVHGSVGVALAAAHFGARVLRVHDVAATHRALATFAACGGLGDP